MRPAAAPETETLTETQSAPSTLTWRQQLYHRMPHLGQRALVELAWLSHAFLPSAKSLALTLLLLDVLADAWVALFYLTVPISTFLTLVIANAASASLLTVYYMAIRYPNRTGRV